METVSAMRRFFAYAYQGGASGQFPSLKDRCLYAIGGRCVEF